MNKYLIKLGFYLISKGGFFKQGHIPDYIDNHIDLFIGNNKCRLSKTINVSWEEIQKGKLEHKSGRYCFDNPNFKNLFKYMKKYYYE